MAEYYHPDTSKTIKLETGFSGGVTTVTETNNGNVQTLTLRESEVTQFVERLVNTGWLQRQLL
jgi:hypothetical protein